MLHFFLFLCNSGGGKIAFVCCEISVMYLTRPASAGSRTSIRCKLQVTHLTSASEGQGDRGVLGTRGGSTDLGQEAEVAAKHGQRQPCSREENRAMGRDCGAQTGRS